MTARRSRCASTGCPRRRDQPSASIWPPPVPLCGAAPDDRRDWSLSGDGRLRRFRVARLRRGARRSRRIGLAVLAALPGEQHHARAVAARIADQAMTRKQQRLGLLALAMAALGGATALVLVAFSDNLVFFYSPSELKTKAVAPDRRVRIGGLVETHSLSRGPGGRQFSFRVTDGASNLPVVYEGLLPDLFREGQGVVVEGKLRPDGVLAATTVLAKHDENYMPREVVDAL